MVALEPEYSVSVVQPGLAAGMATVLGRLNNRYERGCGVVAPEDQEILGSKTERRHRVDRQAVGFVLIENARDLGERLGVTEPRARRLDSRDPLNQTRATEAFLRRDEDRLLPCAALEGAEDPGALAGGRWTGDDE